MVSGSERFIDPIDGTEWDVDMAFMASSWRCIWGEGCEGILERPAAALQQGCCSVGAEVLEEEAAVIGALGMSLDPARFQMAEQAADGGVFADSSHSHTRVVDGACIFFNRPGFDGGAGCALHLSAVDEGERPMDWKPAVCWQVPFRVATGDDGTRSIRRWEAEDWSGGERGGEGVAWCCTDRAAEPSAYVGSAPVAESMADELAAVVGPEVAVEIRRRIGIQPLTEG